MAEPNVSPARPWWRRLATVRARTTAAVTAIVGAAIAVGAVSLVLVLHRSLVHNIDDVAEARAQDVATLVQQGSLPPTLGVTGEDAGLTQVVDASGQVLASTAGLAPNRRLATFLPSGTDPEFRTATDLPADADDGPFRVLALAATGPNGPVTIYVATSMEPVDDAIGALRTALIVGSPVLLALVAVTAWVLVGRALHPVDAITSQADAISDRSLDRRVPVPPAADEISRLALTVNRMLDRLEAGAQRQRRFVADASHELQSPLASTRADLEVALAHPDRADWPDTARQLLAENRQMESLVRDLLHLARADSGAPRPAALPVDLDDVVLSEAARLKAEGRCEVDTSRVSAAAVLGRRNELSRAVRNLLDNAARYAASRVDLTLRADDECVTLVVTDDGPGVPSGDRDRIFERFSRLDAARGRDSGSTGLGLAIVRDIVEGHGGTIAVGDATSPGAAAGAQFEVRLPPA
jgi:signal transduction histidine kinase